MANIKAAAKAWRKNIKQRAHNNQIKEQLRNLVKLARKEVLAKQSEKAIAGVKVAIKALDKARQKGIIKKNNAARRKSRLMKKLNSLNKS
ncbi:MAG: 30S ribosomal protein S20 [Candidatus Buchananbacteria bacterium]